MAGGPVATAIQGKYDKEAAKKAAELAKQQQKASLQLINEMDFEPMYASSQVPTYQRSQSPVARSFIDSFLMGNNPASVMPNAVNAGAKRQAMQTQQNAMFGTPQERLAQQNAYRESTPWKVTTPTRPIKPAGDGNGNLGGAAGWTAQHTDLAGSGFNKKLYDTIESHGVPLDSSLAGGGKVGLQAGFSAQSAAEVLKRWYNGDADRMAADIEAAGGYDQLLAKRGKR